MTAHTLIDLMQSMRVGPGNVRELLNLIEMGVALTPHGEESLQYGTIAGLRAAGDVPR